MILKNQVHRRLNSEQQDSKPQFRIRKMCMVLNNTMEIQDLSPCSIRVLKINSKKKCKVKNDTKFKMKLGVNFDDLPVYNEKYHLKCFNTLWETANLTKPVQCISIVLNLIRQIDPLLNEAWLLSMTNLLNQLKSILKYNNYELFDSYSRLD